MRDKNVYNFRRCLPRMSWSPRNLWNLYRRSIPGADRYDENIFTSQVSSISLFQQRWKSKTLTRAYHGDHIGEKIFKRWYVPSTLPDVRPRLSLDKLQPAVGLMRWAQKDSAANKARRQLTEEEEKGQAPVGSLMFTDVERRIDVIIFRACLAHSVYEARRMVVHGDVLLNGKKHSNANTRLAPGDMVSVDPKAIRFLQPEVPAAKNTSQSAETKDTTESASAEASSEKKPAKDSKSKLTPFNLPPFASPWIFIPAYLEVSFATCSAVFLRHPTARPGYSEIPTPYDADGEIMRLTWEWYAKRHTRMRSKSQLARMPENRGYVHPE